MHSFDCACSDCLLYCLGGYKMIQIKPFYFYRNGVLHKRYTLDEAVELSETEIRALKRELSGSPVASKQDVLAKNWELQTKLIGKKSFDGVAYVNRKIEKARNEKGKY